MLAFALSALLAVLAGAGLVLQQILNANLRAGLDSASWAGVSSYAVGLACMALLAAALRDPVPTAGAAERIPWWTWSGGLFGAVFIGLAILLVPKLGAATFFAAQHDFAEAGDLLLFTDEHWLAEIERQMDAAGGVLPGAAMADTFNALRANDLIWSFFVSNYLMGKDPPAFDLLFWNADQTRMPKALHMAYLRRMYGENALANGRFEIGGETADLSRVTIPLYFQASREDHIAPMNSVYRSARLFGGDVVFTLAGSGHIAGVINPPSASKYKHWTNDALPASLADWQAGAVEHPGSWWEHWAAWLRPLSGPDIPARDPTKGPLKPIEPAPGAYVKVKS